MNLNIYDLIVKKKNKNKLIKRKEVIRKFLNVF